MKYTVQKYFYTVYFIKNKLKKIYKLNKYENFPKGFLILKD